MLACFIIEGRCSLDISGTLKDLRLEDIQVNNCRSVFDCLIDVGNCLIEIATEVEVLCHEIEHPKMNCRILLFFITFESHLFLKRL